MDRADTAEAAAVATMNIYQRVNEVRQKVAYLRKEKKVEGSGYMAVTHDQVTGELREFLILFGIVITPPSVIKSVVADTGTKTSKGTPFIRYEATYRIGFVNMMDPKDRIEVEIEAHAIDQGDKAPGKAMSYATKYAMLKLFSIETGDDEEERQDVKASKKTISPTDGAIEGLSKDRQEACNRIASGIVECFDAGQSREAYKAYTEVKSNDERIAIWQLLKPHSKIRSALKRMDDEMKAAAMGGQA